MGYTANARIERLYERTPLRDAAERIVRGMSEELHSGAVRRTPVAKPPPGMGATSFAAARGRTPGTLRRAWRKGELEVGLAGVGVLRFGIDELNDDEQWEHVEYDTRPHIIRPRKDRAPASVLASGRPRLPGTDPRAALAWPGAGGRTVFAHEVHHPGTRGVHMTRDALAEVDATWVERVGDEEMVRWAAEQEALIP